MARFFDVVEYPIEMEVNLFIAFLSKVCGFADG
jgi:hypothetical protein